MRQELFEERYSERWRAFEAALATGRKPGKRGTLSAMPLTPMPVEEFPSRYREICHHLALSRDRQYSTALVERLEHLALAGHQWLYGARAFGGSVREFLFHGFPALVRRRIRYIAASSLLFFGPLIACLIVIQLFPDFAQVVLDSNQLNEAQQMYAPGNTRLGLQRSADNDFVMFGFYVANNVRIDFQCFAGGILFGVGAVFFMLFNGLVIGTVAGHLTHMGYIETFWGFVAGHSAFELTGVVLSGAAGLMVGMALIAPGRRGRFAALRANMSDIIGLVYGASLFTFLAAFIEAFWSASRLPPVEVKYAVGIFLWIVTLSYLVLTGRARKGWKDAS